MTNALAESLLHAWFGDALDDPAHADDRNKLWFRASDSFDGLLRDRYGSLPDRMLAGEFDHWKDAPRSALARVIALDQIPRNVYRGRPCAFAYDAAALASAEDAVHRGYDLAVHPLQAAFLYLPFEHAEDRAMQTRSIELFSALRERSPAALVHLFDSYLDYAHRHAKVIAEFGRFPHRNEILGRTPTAAETAYLVAGGQRF